MGKPGSRTRVKLPVAILILAVTIFPASARTGLPEAIAKWKTGQRIQVTLNSGEKIIGKRGAIQPDGFILEPDKPTQIAREVRFTDMRSATTKWTGKEKWGVALLIYGGFIVVGIIVGG